MPSVPPNAPPLASATAASAQGHAVPTVVLSAGGPAAWMFHLGVLAGLESHGYRSTETHLIGTSAGSAVAAMVKSGASLAEVREAVLSPPVAERRGEIITTLRETRRQLADRTLINRVRPLAPRFVRQALPGGRGIAMALAGALPSGFVPTQSLGLVDAGPWPDQLWITAVDSATGDVVVFGRDPSEASLSDAVEASSAVPGVFQPKRLDGREFVDGAVSSSTHAALAAETQPPFVVVSSVQTRAGRRPVRIGARRRLASEVAVLGARGIPVVVIEPDEAALASEKSLMRPGFPGATGIIAAGERLATAALAEFAVSSGNPT